jgi:hypothetical protein
MTTKLHDALTEALECVKAGGVIRKYSLVWSGRSEAPRIIVWKATNTSDDALRRSLEIIEEGERPFLEESLCRWLLVWLT